MTVLSDIAQLRMKYRPIPSFNTALKAWQEGEEHICLIEKETVVEVGIIGVVYGLASDEDGFRYVGASQNPNRRFSMHKGRSNNIKNQDPLANWIRKTGKKNIQMIILEECASLPELEEKEQKWIDRFVVDGCLLLNRQLQSAYPHKFTKDTLKKIRLKEEQEKDGMENLKLLAKQIKNKNKTFDPKEFWNGHE